MLNNYQWGTSPPIKQGGGYEGAISQFYTQKQNLKIKKIFLKFFYNSKIICIFASDFDKKVGKIYSQI
jgi:hypothetical protein